MRPTEHFFPGATIGAIADEHGRASKFFFFLFSRRLRYSLRTIHTPSGSFADGGFCPSHEDTLSVTNDSASRRFSTGPVLVARACANTPAIATIASRPCLISATLCAS